MLKLHSSSLLKSHGICFAGLLKNNDVSGARYASLNSAINQGIYGARSADNRRTRPSYDRTKFKKSQRNDDRDDRPRFSAHKDRRDKDGPAFFARGGRSSNWSRDSEFPRKESSNRPPMRRDEQPSRDDSTGYSDRRDHRAEQSKRLARHRERQAYLDHLYMEKRKGKWVSQDNPFGRSRKERHSTREPWESKSSQEKYEEIERQYESQQVARHVAVVAPSTIPYTTAASEFIYGTSAVMAALRCGRRKLYKLYIYEGGDKVSARLGRKSSKQPMLDSISKFGLTSGVHVKHVSGNWDSLLARMSEGRPHNGCILEASPLPKVPVDALLPVSSPQDTHFTASVCKQSAEEAEVNGIDGRIARANQNSDDLETPTTKSTRYPFTLLLDGIVDPGNVGAIIRSAYYFGVDSIILSTRNSAPISPITIKASAGAAEKMPLMVTTNPAVFVENSRANGWKFFAAEAPAAAAETQENLGMPAENQHVLHQSDLKAKLTEAPCVLMLGSEEQGLSKRMMKQADGSVVIPGAFTGAGKEDVAGVDSLNVSVASALLCQAFLGDPACPSSANDLANNMMSTIDMIREEAKENPSKRFMFEDEDEE
ncbi:hypothetical protein FQN53_009365 [Emmonsiellopsis sp. PD_33]|nr:hypothetical protein FQN53_009365 [Emmonsiellopsis sp. PD_33]